MHVMRLVQVINLEIKRLKLDLASIDISTFSFHPLKTITTAEGGIVTTNSTKFLRVLSC